jgi:hypothetical protein
MECCDAVRESPKGNRNRVELYLFECRGFTREDVKEIIRSKQSQL